MSCDPARWLIWRPSKEFSRVYHCLSCPGVLWSCHSPALMEGWDHFPELAGQTFASRAKAACHLLWQRNTFPSPIQLFVYQGHHLQSCFLDRPLAPTDCTGLSFPRCKMPYLLMSNFTMFVPTYFSELSLQIPALPSSVLPTFPILLSSTNPITTHLCIQSLSISLVGLFLVLEGCWKVSPELSHLSIH